MSSTPGELKNFVIDGAQIACLDSGDPSSDSTLLLVHGFPLTHAMWRNQVAGLSDACRIIAPDLRGYGESSLGEWPIEDDARDAKLDRYAKDLAALLDALDVTEPIVYCGFSMGGYIAWSFRKNYCERIRALILADTRVVADDDAARATRHKMADHVEEWGAVRIAEIMRPNLLGPSASEEAVEEIVREIASANPKAIAASQRAMAARPDSTSLLEHVDVPTLVVVGSDDVISTPQEMRDVADSIPNAQYALIHQAGHMTPIEQPGAFNGVLRDFLATLM